MLLVEYSLIDSLIILIWDIGWANQDPENSRTLKIPFLSISKEFSNCLMEVYEKWFSNVSNNYFNLPNKK